MKIFQIPKEFCVEKSSIYLHDIAADLVYRDIHIDMFDIDTSINVNSRRYYQCTVTIDSVVDYAIQHVNLMHHLSWYGIPVLDVVLAYALSISSYYTNSTNIDSNQVLLRQMDAPYVRQFVYVHAHPDRITRCDLLMHQPNILVVN